MPIRDRPSAWPNWQGAVQVSMLFTARSPHKNWRLTTLLTTTHIPLAQVIRTLSPTLVQRQLTMLHRFCRQYLAQPVLKVAGLNPHAGEAGHLGRARSVIGWSPA